MWSLLVAGGYLKVLDREPKVSGRSQMYTLDITNAEVRDMFYDLVRGWFRANKSEYNGFVLGLLVELNGDYTVTSNRESGFGRYDVMIEPTDRNRNAYILEFKVHDADDGDTLADTARAAHAQIEEKQYEAAFAAKGIPSEHIFKYGFAFEGKKVLIG